MRTSFLTHQKKLAHLSHIQALLGRDQEALMPVKAGPGRAEQMGYLATIHYETLLDGAYEKLLEDLVGSDSELEPRQQRSVRLAYKELQQTKRLDVHFVEHFETVKARAQQVRFDVRKTNDFQLFAPHLEEIISLSRQYAMQIEPTKDPYDTLLDIYEEDATQAWYDALLLPLQQPLTDLITSVVPQKGAVTGDDRLSTEETKKLLYELSKKVGFDFDAGLFGEVHHPFMTTLGGYDYRINTRYDHPVEAITGMIHELGHGLYEQRVDPKFFYTNLHYGASTGMHESQSRTLENMIGRSKGMSEYLDRLSKKFGKQYGGSANEWYTVCNRVKPSLIRLEADEISYGLHILLRYELEKDLIAGRLSVQDLPTARNEKMITYLGIAPKTDIEGCLQDVHRSCGLFGYFPTYLLGNLYAGQMWTTFTSVSTDWETKIAKGDFTDYFDRYKENIWQRGRSLSPKELIHKVTGAPVDPSHFLAYLQTKFS